MKNLKTNLHIWLLIALGLSTTRAAAQAPVDTTYERTLLQLNTQKDLVIDTIDVTAPLNSYVYGFYDNLFDEIHIIHFAEKYDVTKSRNPSLLWGKKHIESLVAHERTHRRNNEMFQRAILKNIVECTQYQIYDEITSIISEIIQLREQMAKVYRANGHLVITDLYGHEFINIPEFLQQNISTKQMYRRTFTSDRGYIDYYIYLTYLINNPSVLSAPPRGVELDYILMAAINLMKDRFSLYVNRIATDYALKPMYVNLTYLASMHNHTYNELIPDATKPVRETPFHIFAYAWKQMGFDINAPTPAPEQIRRAARAEIAKFKSGEIATMSFDELIQKMFIFDGINYLSECSPETTAAVLKHIDKQTKRITAKWRKNIETVKFHNVFIEMSWADYHNQTQLIQTFENKKHR